MVTVAHAQQAKCVATIFQSTQPCKSFAGDPCSLLSKEELCKGDIKLEALGFKPDDCRELIINCHWIAPLVDPALLNPTVASTAKPLELPLCPQPRCPAPYIHTFEGFGSQDPWCCTQPLPNPVGNEFSCHKRSTLNTNKMSRCRPR